MVTSPRTNAAVATILPVDWLPGWRGCGDAAGAAGAPPTGGWPGVAVRAAAGSGMRNHTSIRSVRAASCSASTSTMPRARSRDGRTPERSGPALLCFAATLTGVEPSGEAGFAISSHRCISEALSRPCDSTATSASPAIEATWPSPSGRMRSHFFQRACTGGDPADRVRSQPGPTAINDPGAEAGPGV